MTDVFGRVHLGYLVIETEKFDDDWRRFGRDAIGMHLDETLPTRCGSASTTTSADSSSADRRDTTRWLAGRRPRHLRGHREAHSAGGVPVTGTSEEALRGVDRLIDSRGRTGADPGGVRRGPDRRRPGSGSAATGGFVTDARAVGARGHRHQRPEVASDARVRTPAHRVRDARLSDCIDADDQRPEVQDPVPVGSTSVITVAIVGGEPAAAQPDSHPEQHGCNVQVAELERS